MDPFIRMCNKKLNKNATLRAYADDLAVVTDDLFALPDLRVWFLQLGKAAGLHINVSKCICVPLYNSNKADVKLLMAQHAWPGMKIQLGYSKYLGVNIGPLANADNNFNMVLDKFKNRCAFWLNQRHLGNFFQITAFNTHCLPILSFIAQFYPLPQRLAKEIQRWAFKFALGPRDWLNEKGYFNASKDVGLKCARCPNSHLLSTFLLSGNRFMFNHNNMHIESIKKGKKKGLGKKSKKRIGKSRQNWIHQTKKYIFLTKMNKSSYEESREQDLQIFRNAKDHLF